MENKTKLLILIFLSIGFFLRVWHLRELMGFDYDQEVAAFAVDRILSGNLTLIGQEISIGGVFIGPGYYYLLAVFYWLFRSDPIGAGYMVALFSLFTMWLLFLVARELYNLKTAFIALIIYATNTQINFYDRTTAPSNLVMLSSLLIIFLLIQVNKGKYYLLPVVFLTLFISIFHIHPSIFVLAPFVLFLFYFWKLRKPSIKQILLIAVLLLLSVSPLVLFDIRHQFINFRGLLSSTELPGDEAYPLVFKFLINIRIVYENFVNLFSIQKLSHLLAVSAIISFWKLSSRKNKAIIALWIMIPILIFGFYSSHIPEYYFLSSLPAFVLIISLFIEKLSEKLSPIIAFSILLLIVTVNIVRIFSTRNPFSLLYKQQTVDYLVSQGRDEVFVSFDTDYGLQSGLNYLFLKQKVKYADSGNNPTHTIVIPPERRKSDKNEIIFGGIKVIKSSSEFNR